MKGVWALILGCCLVACAATENEAEVVPTSKYRKSVYATRANSVYAYCYVEFSLLEGPPTATVFLENDTLVACNGVRASVSGSGYYANFEHEDGQRVRVTLVRPKSGATTVEYFPIQ